MRIAKLIQELDQLDAFIVENPIDLFYLTGLELSAGTLVVGKEVQRLFVDGRYIEVASKRFGAELTSKAALQGFLKPFEKVGFDSNTTSFERYQYFQEMGLNLVPSPHLMQWVRAIKDPEEIEAMRKAADLATRGYRHLHSCLKAGVTELDLVKELKLFWLNMGAEAVSFAPIIAFGPNSAMPHYHPQNVALKEGVPVLIDIGVELHHYQSDLTRVDFFGKPDPKLQEIYDVVRDAKAAATDICCQGVASEELDEAARSVIEDAGYGDYFVHNLGHGVGLEVHEYPRLRKKTHDCLLKANMVITIEPGIYLPGLGGVRLEDTVLVTESGCETLTH